MFEKITSVSVRYARPLYGRWRTEWDTFLVGRSEIVEMDEFWVALMLAFILFITVIPSVLAHGTMDTNPLWMIGIVCVFGWFIGLGVITVGNVLFDNIPLLSDVSSIVDGMDGLGVNRVRRLSVVLKKKERMEDYVSRLLQNLLIFLTAYLFRKARRMLVWVYRHFRDILADFLEFGVGGVMQAVQNLASTTSEEKAHLLIWYLWMLMLR